MMIPKNCHSRQHHSRQQGCVVRWECIVATLYTTVCMYRD
uniref:Uncharacterized protein n=1 Tax=Arundo donax TaxID=35708 RepID=A0A0A9A104_ARUDO